MRDIEFLCVHSVGVYSIVEAHCISSEYWLNKVSSLFDCFILCYALACEVIARHRFLANDLVLMVDSEQNICLSRVSNPLITDSEQDSSLSRFPYPF